MAAKICEVSYTVVINADATTVWRKICQECSILDWNSRIAACESSTNDQGQIVRNYTLHRVGDYVPTMVETELNRSDAIMMITYVVEMTVLPITDYVAQILVTPLATGQCETTIRSRFIDTQKGPDASELVDGFYRNGLDELAKLMEA